MNTAQLAALHHTGPWYVAVPVVAAGLILTVLRRRGGGRRGPFGGGPFGRGPFGGGGSSSQGPFGGTSDGS